MLSFSKLYACDLIIKACKIHKLRILVAWQLFWMTLRLIQLSYSGQRSLFVVFLLAQSFATSTRWKGKESLPLTSWKEWRNWKLLSNVLCWHRCALYPSSAASKRREVDNIWRQIPSTSKLKAHSDFFRPKFSVGKKKRTKVQCWTRNERKSISRFLKEKKNVYIQFMFLQHKIMLDLTEIFFL